MIVAASLFTISVAMRQTMLHIAPGDPGYGTMLFGVHLYTWNVLLLFAIIISMSLAHLFDIIIPLKFYNFLYSRKESLSKSLTAIVITLSFANLLSTYLECGTTMCPSDPIIYIELAK